jgi:hypothetical protein
MTKSEKQSDKWENMSEPKQRDITISFATMIGLGSTKNTITVTGQYKFVTRNYLFLFVLITDTKTYSL